MSKTTESLLSFPSNSTTTNQREITAVDQNDWDEDESEIKAALNNSFLESLDDSTKFSYAGVCAEALYLLYGVKQK